MVNYACGPAKINEINKVGYLLRTTAVYGSGKFGLSDFVNTKEVTDFNQPFRAEMLSVYIIREFSVELVEHVAKKQNPNKAVKLEDKIKQHLGIGNSTGLGMAPFIIKHPKLINKWMNQYTESLNKIINKNLDSEKLSSYIQLLEKALLYLKEVTTFDEYQIKKNTELSEDLIQFKKYLSKITLPNIIIYFEKIYSKKIFSKFETEELQLIFNLVLKEVATLRAASP